MLEKSAILEHLAPFAFRPDDLQISKIATYLALLLKWNQKISLTSVRSPEDLIARHFGESFFVASLAPFEGELLDIGSGAGFPGLALKIILPDLRVTLLEPVAKKRAFLKEVARACEFRDLEVRGERLEDFAPKLGPQKFNAATCRAVGHLEALIPLAADCLEDGGTLCLWLTTKQAQQVCSLATLLWREPAPIPASHSRVILIGQKQSATFVPEP
jgi:16S rRNA (guanine527-N7)-methyltransferase